jgi:3-hydroxy-3-methylglutaryl CoA synthase
MMAAAWDTPAMPGERTAAGGDQDSLTLGVEAALTAVARAGADDIDAIYFATTTPPYAEKHMAATIAAVLGRHDVSTADVTGSLRAGTQALRAALDAVEAGRARRALVVAADLRPAEPASGMEQLFGDGAAALVIGPDAPAEVIGAASIAEEFTGPWRRTGDAWVRSFDAKIETDRFVASSAAAARTALEAAGTTPDAIDAFASFAPDPRTFVVTAKQIGIAQAKDALFREAGNLGAAHALVALAGALDEAQAGQQILVAAAGEGADALVIGTRAGITDARPVRTLADALARKRLLPSYERYARARRLLDWDDPDTPSSTIRTWRDRGQAFALQGVRCTSCGTVQFPANRACVMCAELDRMEPQALQRTGTVFTFTLDHLIAGEYLETPVPRAVVDLDGGGRLYCQVTDCEPERVAIDMPLELTFRRIHEGGGFNNYFWKARPA